MHTQNRKIVSLIGALAALALPATFALAQGPTVAAVRAAVKPASVARGGKGTFLVTVAVSPGFHINAARPNDPALIPTVFMPHASAGITFGPTHYPASKPIKVSYENKPMLVYTGNAVIAVPFTIAKTAKPGVAFLTGTVSYQGCNATSCYPPASAPVKASVTIK